MKVYAITQKGVNKVTCDDRILIGNNLMCEGQFCCFLKTGIVAVADGVGGNNAGDIAAQFVLNRIAMESDAMLSEGRLYSINKDLIAYSKRNEKWKSMATTVSGLQFLDDSHEMLFHVGNTRVYVIQGGEYLKQVTEDDTTVNYLVKTGKLMEEEAENYEKRNEIIACFGGEKEQLMRPTVKSLNISVSQSFLLTSDGVHEYLSTDDMEAIISSNSDGMAICQQIINEALKNGSQDDMSIIYLEGD